MFGKTMISRFVYFVLLLNIVPYACSRSKGTDNFLVVSSMDGEQYTRLDAEEAQVFRATVMDTSRYSPRDGVYHYSISFKPSIRGEALDSSSLVIRLDKIKQGLENENSFILCAQFDSGLLSKVYYGETGQGSYKWIGVETYLGVVRENGKPLVKLNAILETIGFGFSFFIEHPYNEEGGYDDIHRYQRIHAEFEVPEDVFKLLGTAAEPAVKQID